MGQSTGGVPVFTGNPKTIHHHYNSIVAGVFRSHVTTLFGAMSQMENRLPAFAWAALRTSAHEGWVKPINIVTCHVETLKSLRLLTIYDFIKKEPLKIIRFMPVVSGQPSCLVDDDPALSSKRMPVTPWSVCHTDCLTLRSSGLLGTLSRFSWHQGTLQPQPFLLDNDLIEARAQVDPNRGLSNPAENLIELVRRNLAGWTWSDTDTNWAVLEEFMGLISSL